MNIIFRVLFSSSSFHKTLCVIGMQVFSSLMYDLVGYEGYRYKRRKKARTEISLDLVLLFLLKNILCATGDEKDRKLKKDDLSHQPLLYTYYS